MKKFARLLKIPGRPKDKAAQSGGHLPFRPGSKHRECASQQDLSSFVITAGTSDIQWLTELNGRSAASGAEGLGSPPEPPSAPRDRPTCLAEIQELRLRLPQLQRDSNQQSFGGKFGIDAYHVLEGRRELIRVQLLLAGSLIRLIRPLDITTKGAQQEAKQR